MVEIEAHILPPQRGTEPDFLKLLKGPKHEIFESGFFTQIRGLWLGDLETGEKN